MHPSIKSRETMECFEHLMSMIKGSDFERKSEIIAGFTGVGTRSVQQWAKDGRQPVGEALVRLRYYLEYLGYGIRELDMLNPAIRDAGRLFAFRIVTLVELTDMVGYLKGNERYAADALLAVLRGYRNTSEAKLVQFKAFCELHAEHLDAIRARVEKVYEVAQGNTHAQATLVAKITPPAKAKYEAPVYADIVIESFAHLVQAMLPLAKALASDKFSADERHRMRQQVGPDGVFRLSNLLHQLCGETARREIIKK